MRSSQLRAALTFLLYDFLSISLSHILISWSFPNKWSYCSFSSDVSVTIFIGVFLQYSSWTSCSKTVIPLPQHHFYSFQPVVSVRSDDIGPYFLNPYWITAWGIIVWLSVPLGLSWKSLLLCFQYQWTSQSLAIFPGNVFGQSMVKCDGETLTPSQLDILGTW